MHTWMLKILALFLALTLAAAACGNDDSTSADQPGDDVAGEPADEPGDDVAGEPADEPGDDVAGEPEGTSLLDGDIPCEQQHAGKRVAIFSPVRDSENDRPIADYLGAYQPLVDCTGVEIVWEGTDQFETEINVRLEGGNPPDVIDYPQPGLMARHVRQGHLIPLPDYVASRLATDFISGWDAYGTVDGVVYGLPGRSNIKSLVWYSPGAFAAAGYEVPTSLGELKALSDQIVADGGVPWCIGAESGVATGWVLTDWMEDFMLRTHGPEVYDQWVNHEIPFNDPKVVEVVDSVGAFVKNPDYLGGETLVKAVATTKFQDGGLPILDGDCYMHRQGSFYSGMWTEGTTIGEDGDVNIFYLPSPADGPAYMLGGGDIYATGTDKPESFDVVRYTGSADYLNAIAAARGDLAPHVDLDIGVYTDPFNAKLAELQLGADVFRFDASDLMPGSVGAGTFWTEVTAWVIGGSTEDFVNNVEASWPS